MNQSNWYVITGGPGTGKTLLIDMLAGMGFATVSEAAREIIDDGLTKGQTLQQIRGDEQAWQYKILSHILDTEAGTDLLTPTFFDRGAHDGLAFLKLKGVTPGAYWEPLTNHARRPYYRKVFLLEPLPAFEHDYARTENAEITKRLTDLTAEVYVGFGMDPVKVPAMSPQERLDFILAHVPLQPA